MPHTLAQHLHVLEWGWSPCTVCPIKAAPLISSLKLWRESEPLSVNLALRESLSYTEHTDELAFCWLKGLYVRESVDHVSGNPPAYCNGRMLLETSQSYTAQLQIQRQDAEIWAADWQPSMICCCCIFFWCLCFLVPWLLSYKIQNKSPESGVFRDWWCSFT